MVISRKSRFADFMQFLWSHIVLYTDDEMVLTFSWIQRIPNQTHIIEYANCSVLTSHSTKKNRFENWVLVNFCFNFAIVIMSFSFIFFYFRFYFRFALTRLLRGQWTWVLRTNEVAFRFPYIQCVCPFTYRMPIVQMYTITYTHESVVYENSRKWHLTLNE